MEIKVTADNIKHGLRGSCTSDPVALALTEAGFIRPYVGPSWIHVDGRNGRTTRQRAATPAAVLDFLERFDNGRDCAPEVFEVDL